MVQTGRLNVLDGLRCVAVLIVMVSHANLGHIVPGGFGVTIFFFLSGYLITTLLRLEFERDGSVNYRAFYLRRTVRIIPPMIACYVVALVLLQSGMIERPLVPAGIVWDMLFLTNYAPPLQPNSHIPIPLWSLDIEEHFYLIFPAIFVLILRLPAQGRMAVVLALIAVALGMRLFEFARGNAEFIFYWTHTRFDAILFGVLLTADQARGNSRGSTMPWFALGCLAIVVSLLVRDEFFRETFRYTVQSAGLFFVFKFLLEGGRNPISTILSHGVMKYVADLSYVLYLIHFPLLKAAEYSLSEFPIAVRIAAAYIAAFGFAVLMRHFLELPLLEWRKRIEAGLQPTGPLRPKGLE